MIILAIANNWYNFDKIYIIFKWVLYYIVNVLVNDQIYNFEILKFIGVGKTIYILLISIVSRKNVSCVQLKKKQINVRK